MELFSEPGVALDLENLTAELSKTVDVLGSHVRQRVSLIILLNHRTNLGS
jgi:hypothetical protein